MASNVRLYGRVILTGTIKAVTGMHIGGSPGALAIGNVDLPVIRDAVTGRPYIPGSSLKGKMRSLSEKMTAAPQNKRIGKDVTIHVAGGDKRDYQGEHRDEEYKRTGKEQYARYWVNPVFGVPGEVEFEIPAPNRLIVRDVPMLSLPKEGALQGVAWPKRGSAEHLLTLKTDLPYTEVKWEAAIDRVTSAAVPRQIERVPAGTLFSPMEIVFNIYLREDAELFGHVLTALQLVQDDYLGGQGSRGSGKIEFTDLTLTCKAGETYEQPDSPFVKQPLADLLKKRDSEVIPWVRKSVPTG
jgi:CRISPR-associated protein Csm3